MADITISIADANIGEVRRAYTTAMGWRSEELDGARNAYMRRCIRRHIRDVAQGAREAAARDAALASRAPVEDLVGEE